MVHPNPVTDNVVISTSDGTPMSQISIYNNEGKKIQEFTQVNSGTSINMNAYTSGLYLIKIQDKNGEMQVMKITKK
jgi:nitrous oxidase accessory protein NosD